MYKDRNKNKVICLKTEIKNVKSFLVTYHTNNSQQNTYSKKHRFKYKTILYWCLSVFSECHYPLFFLLLDGYYIILLSY